MRRLPWKVMTFHRELEKRKKKENMNDLSIGCYVLSACICCSREEMAIQREERIYVTKRRLSSENHASIDAFLGRNRIVFISLRASQSAILFIYVWKLEISLFNYSSILFFLFSSFFGNFSKVFCEFFPSLVCFAGLMIGSSVCASAITTSHEQTLTPIRPKSSAEFIEGIRMSETFNF